MNQKQKPQLPIKALLIGLGLVVVLGAIVYIAIPRNSNHAANTPPAESPRSSSPSASPSSLSSPSFQSEEGDFKAQFPDIPTRKSGTLPGPFGVHYVQYVSNNPQGVSAMVEVFIFPKNYLQGPNIKEAINGITNSVQEAISQSTFFMSPQFSTYQNYQAMDATIQTGKRYLRIKSIAVGDKVYAVSTLSQDKSETTFTHFMDSFELMK